MIAALGGSKGVAASAARLAFCSAGSFLQQPVVDDRVIERRIRDSSFRIEGAVLTHPTLHQNESTIFDSEQLLCVAVCLCCVGDSGSVCYSCIRVFDRTFMRGSADGRCIEFAFNQAGPADKVNKNLRSLHNHTTSRSASRLRNRISTCLSAASPILGPESPDANYFE